ncbi:MAG: formyl transferase [Gammaproteobacteria bacterium]|nr:formyl transferase [Gammaproteobacteria bacterium]
MSIVILVGGPSSQGSAEHRYLVQAFLDRFGDSVAKILTTNPPQRSLLTKVKRTLKRGQYRERVARALYKKPYGPDPSELQSNLFPEDAPEQMPGGDRVVCVDSHNSADCELLLQQLKPKVIVVYGTAIIREHIFSQASIVTLNMHTGLSPYYRGDSTLFWPVYFNDPEHLGVTVHKIAANVDGGDIVYTGKVTYEPGDSEAALFAKGVKIGSELYLQAVQEALDNTIVYHPQDLSIGQEFRWIHRTVAAEKKVLEMLDKWSKKPT